MALLLADLADNGTTRGTLGSTVTSLAAGAAVAGELTLDAWVGAFRLVVTDFATVEALARIRWLVWAIASEVTLLMAAVMVVSDDENRGVRITYMRHPPSAGASS